MRFDVIYATDENYAMYTGISIYSLYENNKEIDDLRVHILDNNINEKSVESLNKIANEFGRQLYFYNAKGLFDDLAKKIKMKNTQTITTYASCFMAKLLGNDIKTALYVDGDSLFLGSVKELAEMSMDDYYVAGSLDTCLPAVRYAIGFEKTTPYLNAGFLLMNFEKIRNANLDTQIFDFIRDVIPTSLHNDQDVVNGVLGKKLKVLPAKYCVLTPLYEKKYDDIVYFFGLENYYSKQEIEDAVKNPVFVHFTPSATKRPWVIGCDHPLKCRWDEYKLKTDWCNVGDKKDKRKFKKKFLDFMYRNLPVKAYINVIKIYERLK